MICFGDKGGSINFVKSYYTIFVDRPEASGNLTSRRQASAALR